MIKPNIKDNKVVTATKRLISEPVDIATAEPKGLKTLKLMAMRNNPRIIFKALRITAKFPWLICDQLRQEDIVRIMSDYIRLGRILTHFQTKKPRLT